MLTFGGKDIRDSIAKRSSKEGVLGMRSPRLVGFLGTADYKECVYRWDKDEVASCYVVHAIAKILAQRNESPQEVIIVCTEEAEKKHGNNLQKCFSQDQLGIQPEFRRIPKGSSPQELWETFSVLSQAFEGCGEAPLIVDITYGFRSQPFFAAAVLGFLRATSPQFSKSELRVLYAGDLQQDGPTPVWDITPAIEVLDWAYSLQLFMKTGRVGPVAELTERLGRAIARQWAQHKVGRRPSLDSFAKDLRAFGDDLATVRTGDLLLGRERGISSARKLAEYLQMARSDIEWYVPPIGKVLSNLEDMARRLDAGGDLTSPAGQRALASLARTYLKMERYMEAITTVREGWITRFAKTEAAWRPGSTFIDSEREKAEKACRSALKEKFDADFGQIRNDLNHGGMNHDPRRASDVKKAVTDAVEKFEKGLEEPLPCGESSVVEGPHVFVNISSHPMEEWAEEQVQAAVALVGSGGIIRDVPFPQVDPTRTDKEYLLSLAEETVAKATKGHGLVTHAMVQGEHTLTFLLVLKLQNLGIRCVAATTERLVEQLGDGTKMSKFAFRGFREYPKL